MNNENVKAESTIPGDEEIMLPEGYREGDPFFDEPDEVDGFDGEEQEDGAEAAPSDEGADPGGGGEDTPSGEDAPCGDPPAEAQEDAAAPRQEDTPPAESLLRFKNGEAEVAVKESDLPGIYQRAQAHDRVNSQLQQLQQSMERVDAIARGMGFESAQAMLDKAAENYREGEVKRLVEEGMHEEAARDLVERRMRPAKPLPAPQAQQEAPARDFRREISELVQQRPELREQLANGGKLPQEVITACVKNGVPLRTAYAEYEAREVKAEAERVRQENEILKQNAANAARAPVKGVAAGGGDNPKGKDPFLEGLLSDE